MNTAPFSLSQAIKQNNYAAIQIEQGNYFEARSVLPSSLYSLNNLLCLQNKASSSAAFVDNDCLGSRSLSSESVDESYLSTGYPSNQHETSPQGSSNPIARKSSVFMPAGDTHQQIDLYCTPIHLDHDPCLQQTLLSQTEQVAILSSSAAAVIFNLALVMHLMATKPTNTSDACNTTLEPDKRRKKTCLKKAESLYGLAMDMVLHNVMAHEMDIFHGKLLLAAVNNLGAIRLQKNDCEAALISFQFIMHTLMLMVDRGLVLGSDGEWFLGNALLAENRFRTTPWLAGAA